MVVLKAIDQLQIFDLKRAQSKEGEPEWWWKVAKF